MRERFARLDFSITSVFSISRNVPTPPASTILSYLYSTSCNHVGCLFGPNEFQLLVLEAGELELPPFPAIRVRCRFLPQRGPDSNFHCCANPLVRHGALLPVRVSR